MNKIILSIIIAIVALSTSGCTSSLDNLTYTKPSQPIACGHTYATRAMATQAVHTTLKKPSCNYVTAAECKYQKAQWVERLKTQASPQVLEYVTITPDNDIVINIPKLMNECKTIAQLLDDEDTVSYIVIDK